mmetsp:Transcript_16401/g.49370  ORF Transcript_16401/g.49370 Transcript_16401/m.49370 type:complete len:231 (+) Transcript_16401:331-1023(+)
MPSKRDVTLLGAVALAALAARYRTPRGEVDVMAAEIANGYRIDSTKTPASLTAGERRRYALAPGKDYVDTPPLGENWQGVVKGGEAWPPGTEPEEPRSPWAVWATGRLLSADECAEWTRRAEALNLETGDFIFAGSSLFVSRFHTGARRHSSTRMVEDETFAATMDRRIRDLVPAALADGRAFGGVGKSFLVSRYEPGQFFAPHFDGRGSGGYNREQHTVSEFTVVRLSC